MEGQLTGIVLSRPARDDDTPPGVSMWTAAPGDALPARCPVYSARFVVEPGAATELDVHDVMEAWTVVSGAGVVVSQGTRHPVVAGDVIHFPGRVDHLLRNESDAPVEVVSFWWRGDQE
jgi:uncharacterized RmlC-like cupin family protein